MMKTLAIIVAAFIIALSPPTLAKSDKAPNSPPGQSEDKPGQSEPPGQSNKPDKTEPPGQGDKPDKSEPPGQSNEPGRSEPPGQSNKPDRSEPPGQSVTPDEAEAPGQSARSGIAGDPDLELTGSIPPKTGAAAPPPPNSTTRELEEAQHAVETREALPLARVVAAAESRTTGHVINARLVRIDGFLLYQLTFLDETGRSWRDFFYARTGYPVVLR